MRVWGPRKYRGGRPLGAFYERVDVRGRGRLMGHAWGGGGRLWGHIAAWRRQVVRLGLEWLYDINGAGCGRGRRRDDFA